MSTPLWKTLVKGRRMRTTGRERTDLPPKLLVRGRLSDNWLGTTTTTTTAATQHTEAAGTTLVVVFVVVVVV